MPRVRSGTYCEDNKNFNFMLQGPPTTPVWCTILLDLVSHRYLPCISFLIIVTPKRDYFPFLVN